MSRAKQKQSMILTLLPHQKPTLSRVAITTEYMLIIILKQEL